MIRSWKFAAVLAAAMAVTSCAGAGYQGAPDDQAGIAPVEVDTTMIGALVLLGLLAAVAF